MDLIRPAGPAGFDPRKLFRPASVAVIGADTDAGAQVLRNLAQGGFAGTILATGTTEPPAPVQPASEIAAFPLAPDLAVIASPPDRIAAELAALGRLGTRGAILVGSGPAAELVQAGRAAGVRILGPNSFGIVMPSLGLNASRAHVRPPAGKLALVSQSAALCRAVLDWAEPNGVGFSLILGIGGNADLGFATPLDWIARDPGTALVLMDIRRVRDRRTFLSAARACARVRQVVAIRAGGRLLDPSGQADAVFEAALRRAGVLCVSSMEELLAAAETLYRAKPPRTGRLAIVTNAIGPGQLAADAALREGIPLAELSEATRQVLSLALPEHAASRAGPVHVGAHAPMRLAETAAMLAGAPEVGAIVAVHAPTGAADAAAIATLAAGVKSLKVPLLVCAMGQTTAGPYRRQLAEAGVPAFATPEDAIRGVGHLLRKRQARIVARELPHRQVLAFAPDLESVRRIVRRVRAAGRAALVQDEALDVLQAYGVPTVPTRVAATPEDAAVAASILGFPAVVKLRRMPGLPRFPGRVSLDLGDAGTVARAAEILLSRLARRAPDTDGVEFLVQRQVARGRELRVSAADDPVFGPAILFGTGGAVGAVQEDCACDLPPLNLSLAHALISRTRAARLLTEQPDQPAANEPAVAETLVRVSQLLVDFPEIESLEIDPLFADDSGVLAGDARLVLRPPGEMGRLAIAPYPGELTERFDARGEMLTIRPIRPEDAEAHAEFFARIPPEDVRYRFFSILRELSAEQIVRMTQVDYDREMAFVAVREVQEAGAAADGGEGQGRSPPTPRTETLGVARLVREWGTGDGEFAILVDPRTKGSGVARRLMQKLVDWARAQGMTRITGQVLTENARMLAFVRQLGFALHRVAGEDDVVEATLDLSQGQTSPAAGSRQTAAA